MSTSPERIEEAVRAMLENRRPQGFTASGEEMEALRAAAALSAARPGAAEPDPGFVEVLAARLRAAAEAPEAAPAPVAPALVLPPAVPRGRRPGRRAFLRAAGLAAAAAAAGVMGDRAVERYGSGSGDDRTAQPALVPAGAVWRDVASLADVRAAGPLRFRAGAVEGVVALTPDGGVMAVSAVCTHMGCLLDVASTSRLRCPCHGVQFEVDGTPAANAYPVPPLPSLRSRISGDRVEVLA